MTTTERRVRDARRDLHVTSGEVECWECGLSESTDGCLTAAEIRTAIAAGDWDAHQCIVIAGEAS